MTIELIRPLIPQRGAGKLTVLVFGLLAGVAVFTAFQIVPFYYYFYELQNQFEAHAKAADMYTNTQLKQKLLYHINRMEIPIPSEDSLRLERSKDTMNISLAYTETFYVTWGGKYYDLHTFNFHAKASEKYR